MLDHIIKEAVSHYCVPGDAVAYWLARWTPDRAVTVCLDTAAN